MINLFIIKTKPLEVTYAPVLLAGKVLPVKLNKIHAPYTVVIVNIQLVAPMVKLFLYYLDFYYF